jgi:uncharacterized membrane protein HdeD (DUF308 family)
MLQFYLLSVLLNVLVGLVLLLSFDSDGANGGGFESDGITRIDDPSLFENRTFRFVLGLASIVVGVVKLFVVTNHIRAFGDLLPALAGILGGVTVLLNHFVSSSTVEIRVTGMPELIFVRGARFIGIACLAVAVLHFIFPRVILL